MPRRGPQLNSVMDVSGFLAKMIRDLYQDKIDATKAGKLAYMCNILKGCLEASDIDKRIAELEARLGGGK